MTFSRGSSQPRDRTQVSRVAGGFFTVWTTREAHTYIHTYIHTVTYLSSGVLIFEHLTMNQTHSKDLKIQRWVGHHPCIQGIHTIIIGNLSSMKCSMLSWGLIFSIPRKGRVWSRKFLQKRWLMSLKRQAMCLLISLSPSWHLILPQIVTPTRSQVPSLCASPPPLALTWVHFPPISFLYCFRHITCSEILGHVLFQR